MRRAVLVIAGLLTACAGRTAGPEAGPSPSPSPPHPVEILVEGEKSVGGTVEVKLRNNSREILVYNTEYEACALTYMDAERRKFLIPPGTHCDLIVQAELAPGDTATLFSWDLEECIEDNWGCVESSDLTPGTYTISGEFRVKGGGDPIPASVTFEVGGR